MSDESAPIAPEDAPPPFVLELALPPAAAARLGRHHALAARLGRGKSTAETLIWEDTAEGALAAEGLAMQARPRGDRQLIVTLDKAAPPGSPTRDSDADLPEAPLVAVAAFDGKRTAWRLPAGDGEVVATLHLGRLRCVAAEAEAARLRLEGPADAVLAVARALAQDMPILPATVSLPEAARALAYGQAPRDRRRGAPRPDPEASLGEALAEAIGHLTEVLLIQAPLAHAGATPDGVHQMRVAARRLRSLLRVFRPVADGPGLRGLDAGLRDVAACLGPARDWDVFLGGIGAALGEAAGTEKRVVALLHRAEAERDAAYATLRQALEGSAWRLLALDLVAAARLQPWRAEVADAALLDDPLPPFGAEVLGRRWRRLKRAARDIETFSMEALHALRLDAKRVRYAAELMAPLWPERATRRFARRMAALQEALGVANDAAVARDLATRLGHEGARRRAVSPWAIGLLEGYALARAAGAREAAIIAWKAAKKAPNFWKIVSDQ